MKHQISKVALIAALAFIGIGFAGTQKANATNCDPQEPADHIDCGSTTIYNDGSYSGYLVCEGQVTTFVGDGGCWDTDGNCHGDSQYRAFVGTKQCTDAQTGVTQSCDSTFYNRSGDCYS